MPVGQSPKLWPLSSPRCLSSCATFCLGSGRGAEAIHTQKDAPGATTFAPWYYRPSRHFVGDGQLPGRTKSWIAAGVTDPRRGLEGQSAQVQNVLHVRPFSGHVCTPDDTLRSAARKTQRTLTLLARAALRLKNAGASLLGGASSHRSILSLLAWE